MNKLLVLFVILGFLATATPAAAAQNEPVGDRINLFAGAAQTFPANTPFNIRQAISIAEPDSGGAARGLYLFTLDVDGVPQTADFTMIETSLLNPGSWQARWWVYNFPSGMTGTHTFTGHFLGPCAELVSGGIYSGSCGSNPMGQVEADFSPVSVTVTFTP